MAFLRRLAWLLRRISVPHLREHTLRTVLTLIGVSSGVSAVVATSVVSDSAFQTFEDATRATAGSAQVFVGNRGAGVPEALVEEIKALADVTHAAPLIHGLLDHSDPEGEPVTVFGVDVLGDDGWTDQLTENAIEIPDELEFIAQPDSVIAARTLAREEDLKLGDTLRLLTPTGPHDLVVRGFVEDVGPIPLFSGRVVLMDLPAAQLLMAKGRKVDRIDITVSDLTAVAPLIAEIESVVAGRGLVRETSMLGRRAKDALRTMRMVIARPGIMAVIVGFFIIFHTMSVSVTQRRHELTLLDALGYSPGMLVGWLAVEGAAIGLLGSLLGLAAGIALGSVSLQFFDDAVASWVRLPEPQLHVTATGVGLALAAGLGTSVFATVFAGRRWFARRARDAGGETTRHASRRQVMRATALAVGGVVVASTLIAFVPANMTDLQLSTYLNVVNVVILASLGSFAPLLCSLAGGAIAWLGNKVGNVAMLFTGSLLERDPAAPTAVIVAIVLSLGWTLGDVTFINSIRSTWLQWMDHHRASHFIVESRPGASIELLTAPPVSSAALDIIRRTPGVGDIIPFRLTEAAYGDRTIVVEGIGKSPAFRPETSVLWPDIAEAFWRGEGVLVGENIASWSGLRGGSTIRLPSPSGERELAVLATFPDLAGGDLGSIALSLERYREWWADEQLSLLHVWIDGSSPAPEVRKSLRTNLESIGPITVTTYAEFRGHLTGLIDGAFAGSYALVMIAFAVSFVGIVNFLVTAAMDRQGSYAAFHAMGFGLARIASVVACEGLLLGIVGATVGIAAGVLISQVLIYFTIPLVNGWVFEYHLPVWAFVTAGVGAIFLGGVAGLIPGLQAVRRGAPRMPPNVRQL